MGAEDRASQHCKGFFARLFLPSTSSLVSRLGDRGGSEPRTTWSQPRGVIQGNSAWAVGKCCPALEGEGMAGPKGRPRLCCAGELGPSSGPLSSVQGREKRLRAQAKLVTHGHRRVWEEAKTRALAMGVVWEARFGEILQCVDTDLYPTLCWISSAR